MKELNDLVQQPKEKKMATRKSTKPKFLTADDIRGAEVTVNANYKKGGLILDKKTQFFSGYHVDLLVDWRACWVGASMRHGCGISMQEGEGQEWSTAFNQVFVNPDPYYDKWSAAEIQDFVLDAAREVSCLLALTEDDSDVPDDIKNLIKCALAPSAFTDDKSEAVAIQKEARKMIAETIRLVNATRCA